MRQALAIYSKYELTTNITLSSERAAQAIPPEGLEFRLSYSDLASLKKNQPAKAMSQCRAN